MVGGEEKGLEMSEHSLCQMSKFQQYNEKKPKWS